MSEQRLPELGGFVTSPKLYLDRNYTKINPHGLLSEQIFGPLRNYKCACGNFSLRSVNRGKVCPKCGVICDSNILRLKTFGKIKLPLTIIKPSKRKDVKKHILRKYDNIIVPIWHDATKTNKCYLVLEKNGEKLYITQDLNCDDYVIPLRITGIQSFILSIEYLKQYIGFGIPVIDDIVKRIFEENWFTDVIKVIPPDLRPLFVNKSSKELITGEINSNYTRLLEQIKRIELYSKTFYDNKETIFQMITNCIEYNKNHVEKQEIVDALIIEIDRLTAMIQHYADEIYELAASLIHGKEGLIRQQLIGKTVEFTGRSVITVDPAILPYQIKVPKVMLYKLWRPHFIHWLTKNKGYNFDSCFNKIILIRYEDNKELFEEFLESIFKPKGVLNDL